MVAWWLLSLASAGPITDPELRDALVRALEVRVAAARVERLALEAEIGALEAALRAGRVDEVAAVLDGPALAERAAAKAEASANVDQLSSVYGPKMPEMVAANLTLKRAESQLLGEVERALGGRRLALEVAAVVDAKLTTELEALR